MKEPKSMEVTENEWIVKSSNCNLLWHRWMQDGVKLANFGAKERLVNLTGVLKGGLSK